MRIKLSTTARAFLFRQAIKRKFKNQKTLARHCMVSERTVRAWQSGASTIPEKVYAALRASAKLSDKQLHPRRLPAYWYTVSAGRSGGAAYLGLYGNPGTPEGRQRGGIESLKTHRRVPDGFIVRKKIFRPARTSRLAELLGIIFGDGHLSKFQVSVTTNSETDINHAHFIKQLFEDTFRVSAVLSKKNDCRAVTIVVSSKNAVEFLRRQGMPQGNKIKNDIKTPAWIFQKTAWKKSFLRGLFDTDGCVYQEKHTVNKKRYAYAAWALTSYAPRLRQGIIKVLKSLGFSPVHRPSQKSVFMHKQLEIKKYFLEIGTHNTKHEKRHKKFIGRVA